jgi:hypothetical protein
VAESGKRKGGGGDRERFFQSAVSFV